MRTSASRRLLRLGDVIGSIALIASLRSGHTGHRSVERGGYGYGVGLYPPPPIGRVLWQLALAEERFYASHNRYAPHESNLDISLPAGWNAKVLTGSPRRYQVRLETRSITCLLWGNRDPGRALDEFQINCLPRRHSRGRASLSS